MNEQILLPGTKGLPITAPLRQGDIAAQGWNVLAADTSFPVAVLKSSALQHNLVWMRRFCERYGAVLAPHGKTTMSPQLFEQQLANGAWGITLANMTQVQIARRFGVRRVLIANQLVARADIAAAAAILREDPGFELFALADSLEGVRRLSDAMSAAGCTLPLLVELGVQGKRAGCRTTQEVMAVARAIAQAPGVSLAGVEGYEGLIDGTAAVSDFVAQLAGLVDAIDGEGLFGTPQILLSAGGSAFFDLVAQGFAGKGGRSRPVLPILRSGCYLTSDHRYYRNLIAELDQRTSGEGEGLRPALEVWSMVQSRPEPTLAILTMGKRDASYDIDLPQPFAWHRPGANGAAVDGWRIEKMNDQHAYLRLPAESTLAVGDLVGCGISHPCTTFDKWPLMLLVDDDYGVQGAINTYF